MPAVGFGMGDVVLGELLKVKEIAAAEAFVLDAYIVIADEACRPRAMKLLQELRDAKRRVDYAMTPAKLGKQLEQAEVRGAKFAVIVESTNANAPVQVKNMKSREQAAIAVGELIQRVG